MKLVSKPQRPPYSFGRSLHRERVLARSQNYTASCDFTHAMLMADIMRSEDKNSRAAQMLEGAAAAVKRANTALWLKSRSIAKATKPRPARNKIVRGKRIK